MDTNLKANTDLTGQIYDSEEAVDLQQVLVLHIHLFHIVAFLPSWTCSFGLGLETFT